MSFPWEDDWGGVAVESDVPWEDTFAEEPPQPDLVLGQTPAPVAEVDSMRPVMAGQAMDLGPQRPVAPEPTPVQPPDAFPQLSPAELGMAQAGIAAFERPKTLGEAVGRGLTFSPLSIVPPVEIPPESSFSEAAVLELANVAKSVPEFLTSAAGIATLFGAKIAPRLVSAGFSADMLLAGLKQAKQAYDNWDQMTEAEKGVAVVDTVSALGFSGLAGAHAAGVKLKAPAKPEFQGPIATGEVLPMPRPAVPVRMPIQLPDAAKVEPTPGVVVPKVEPKVEPVVAKTEPAPAPKAETPAPPVAPKPEPAKAAPSPGTALPTSVAPSEPTLTPKQTAPAVAVPGEGTTLPDVYTTYVAPATGKKRRWVRKDGVWYSATTLRGSPILTKKPLEPGPLSEALDKQAANPKPWQRVVKLTTVSEPTTPAPVQKVQAEVQKVAAPEPIPQGTEWLEEAKTEPAPAPVMPEWTSAPQQGKVYRQFRILENRFKNGTPAEQKALDLISDNEFGTRRYRPSPDAPEEAVQEAYNRLMTEGGLAWSPVLKSAKEDVAGPPKAEPPAPPVAPETVEGTGLKHAIDELERVGYNLAGRTKQEVQNMWDSYQRAKDTLDKNPDAGRELIDAMASDPRRRISREEHPVLLRYKVAIENAINDAAERTVSGPMEGRAEARDQFNKRRAELQKFLDVLAFSGSEAGREMRWRQALAFEDFSFASQERRLAAAKGRPLTDPEIVALKQQLADLKAKRDAAEKAYAEREQRAAEAAVKKALDELSRNAPPTRYAPRVLEIAENFANYMDGRANAALTRLRERAARMGTSPDPAIVSDLAIVGAAKITRGAVEFAKWSDAMIREVGEWARPHLDEAFKKAQALFDSELGNVGKKVGRTIATVVRKKLSEKPVAEQVTAITSAIGRKLGKSSNAEISVLVRKLARLYVDQGIKTQKELIDRLYADILPFAPDLTRRAVMDAFSGYGEYRLLPKDAVSVILRDLKGQSQQIAKLEDMAAGQAPKKTGVERRTPSDIERQQIKQVEEAKRRGGYSVTDPATQLRTAMDAVKTRLQNEIADLETQIQTRQKIVKDRTKLQYDAEANRLKARRDELKAQFDEIFPQAPMTEAERLQRWKEHVARRTAEINEMIRSGDIEKKPARPQLELDAEANRLKAQFEEAKDRLQHERDKAEWDRLSVFQKVGRGAVDTYDAARLILTTGEFSFILRQGLPVVSAHPIQSARALPAMFKSMRNWKTAREVDLRITEHPDFAAAKKAGLHIVDETASISRQEEITAGRWAHALPVVAHFNRAARTFLNKIRFDTWLAMRKTMHRFGEPTPEGDALIAKHINEATGRGSLGFAEPAAVALGRFFFAPRYAVSRFQYLTGHSLWAAPGKGTAAARATIALEYARELIGMGLFLATLKALFNNSTTQSDPRSTDFLKLVMGNTRLDALAGLSQAAVFSARTALTGVNASRDALGLPLFRPESLAGKGKPVRLHKPKGQKQPFGNEGYLGTVENFLRLKAHPVPSIYLNLMSGSGFAGKEATVESELGGLAAPITYQDIYTALRTEGLDHKTALSLLAILGVGIQTYNTKK